MRTKLLRRATDVFSRYNRELAFHVQQGVKMPGISVLEALAVNEVQLVFLVVKWSGLADEVRYELNGLKIEPKGAFARVTDKQVRDALKDMK